jgi:hypothetical protein
MEKAAESYQRLRSRYPGSKETQKLTKYFK